MQVVGVCGDVLRSVIVHGWGDEAGVAARAEEAVVQGGGYWQRQCIERQEYPGRGAACEEEKEIGVVKGIREGGVR